MYLSLEHRGPVRHLPFMAATTEDDVEDLRRWGLALKALRQQSGMSQEQAAEALSNMGGGKRGQSFTSQAWGPYERGKAEGLRQPSTQARMAEALGATREALLLEYQKLSGVNAGLSSPMGTAERGGHYDFGGGPTRRLVVTDDLLHPWASSGTTVVYSLQDWPRAGDGVVLVPLDGSAPIVKIYESADAEKLTVRELSPTASRQYSRKDYTAYRVTARLD